MQEKTYKMIDLNLSSGTIWADRNVGAENPWDKGAYFSWGNVDGHAVDENGNVIDGYLFDKNAYATTLGGQYTGSTLDAEHDAVTVNMGSELRMPTIDETEELVHGTDHYYIDLEGNILNNVGFIIDKSGNTTEEKIELLSSKKLRSICFVKKGEEFDYNNRSNFIEFPFAGDCDGSLLRFEGLDGGVWSSSISVGNVEYARELSFNSGGLLGGGDSISCARYYGQSVRGVTSNNKIKK